MIRQDLGAHFFWCALLTAGMLVAGVAPMIAFYVTAGVAVVKDVVWDKLLGKGTFDLVDIAYGVGAGLVVAGPQM